ncbi:MAG: DUF429 domain-containing protein [Gemmatimonadetes bacterium]|nr:DUF429 domain-containing protein [Gemmatimonadota bacterium]
MSKAFVIGYDPGGNGAHGVAALEVREENGRWHSLSLQVEQVRTLRDAVAWLKDTCCDGRIVAAGVDTLTEWNSGPGGWRPADKRLKERYREVANQILAPNSLAGSMAVNGAAFLRLLRSRFRADSILVTEAHPKVCVFALTRRKYIWAEERASLEAWLLDQLGINVPPEIPFGEKDHCFDAGMAVLAALRGLNGDWRLDLHDLPDADQSGRVLFCGRNHYWWPAPPEPSAPGKP